METIMFAAIPSPSTSSIQIGALELRAYGLMIALGALLAVWISSRRYEASGGDPSVVHRMATWAIPAGIVGARLYHVATDFNRFRDNWLEIPQLWKGGLGIWGAVAGGALVAWWSVKRDGGDVPAVFDATAVGIPVAQAIGRVGNWFNQELFGRPTDLPWGLEIDVPKRPMGYLDSETFHPTFLYEAIWNLGVAGFVAFAVPRLFPNLKKGYSWAVYVAGYTVGRLWIELLRIDKATELFGMRVNVWTSLVVLFAAVLVVMRGLRNEPPKVIENQAKVFHTEAGGPEGDRSA
ncbi:MAG: prolipoprotein diacylglyceryl transferase [Actinomycetota bacterium]|nr:prolipoprotein diacylglyceryl transferase [Actinomycetota bacterium]MEC9058893.1 prolipoprotein diacylglyceryl transferase [Actinomycetota bacterium]